MTDARRAIERYLPGEWYWMDSDRRHPLARLLDTHADIDAVVIRRHGPTEWISWRESKPPYLFTTMTFRHTTDNGSTYSQWKKIVRGISVPSWYIHAYGEGSDVYGWMIEGNALRLYACEITAAGDVERRLVAGSNGQLFVPIEEAELLPRLAVRWGAWP